MIFSKSQPTLLTGTMLALLIGFTSGCTSINSGLQTGDLPPTGAFVANNGLQFNIQPLNAVNLPPPSYPSSDYNSKKNARVHELIRSSRPSSYRISSGDILNINLISYPEITPPSTTNSNASNPYASGYPVDQQGYIQFPLVGRIKAGGVSVPQFTNTLRTRLKRYLKYPDPQVKLVNFRGNKFFINGEVRQPGEFSINDTPVSLYSAISMAGGTLPTGDSNNIIFTRQGRRYGLGLKDMQDMGISAGQIYLRDGDTIHVKLKADRDKVFVLGEFGKVAPLEIPDKGLSLANVIGESQGLKSTTADAAKIYVVRNHPNMNYSDIYYVDLQQITNLALANRFQMQSNDLVYVDATGLTRWSRFVNSILPSTSAISAIKGL